MTLAQLNTMKKQDLISLILEMQKRENARSKKADEACKYADELAESVDRLLKKGGLEAAYHQQCKWMAFDGALHMMGVREVE